MDKTNRRKQRNTEEDWKAYLEKRREYRNAWRKNLKKKTSEAPEYEFPSIYIAKAMSFQEKIITLPFESNNDSNGVMEGKRLFKNHINSTC